MCLFISRKTLPQINLIWHALKGFFHDRFSTMAQILEHLTDAAFIGKAHHDKSPEGCLCIFQRRRIAPKSTRTAHDGFVKSRIWKTKKPYLVNFVICHTFQDVEALDDSVIIHL